MMWNVDSFNVKTKLSLTSREFFPRTAIYNASYIMLLLWVELNSRHTNTYFDGVSFKIAFWPVYYSQDRQGYRQAMWLSVLYALYDDSTILRHVVI